MHIRSLSKQRVLFEYGPMEERSTVDVPLAHHYIATKLAAAKLQWRGNNTCLTARCEKIWHRLPKGIYLKETFLANSIEFVILTP